MLIKIPVADDFDLCKILKYRPFFFFFEDKPLRSFLYKGKLLDVEFFQEDDFLELNIEGNPDDQSLEFLRERIRYCLGVGENYSDFYTIVRDDHVLSKHTEAIYGNRLLSAFTDFEAAVMIICSQNVSFRLYKSMAKKIVDAYGEGVYFPEPGQILANPGLLAECGAGYRDKFILDMCRYYLFREKTDLLKLSEIRGFGPYSMDIFRLFQLRDYGYFYVDRLIKKIFADYYKAELMNDFEVRSFAKNKFGKYAGLCEVYLQKLLCDYR
ncbi:MAG: hypothetical protein ABIG84_02550 [archaeon]